MATNQLTNEESIFFFKMKEFTLIIFFLIFFLLIRLLKKRNLVPLNDNKVVEQEKICHSILSNRDTNLDAFYFLRSMMDSGTLPNLKIWTSLIQMSFNLNQIEIISKLLQEIEFSGVLLNIQTFHVILVEILNHLKDHNKVTMKEVTFLLEEMNRRKISFNTETYSLLIQIYLSLHHIPYAMSAFREMCNNKIQPDSYTCECLLKAISNINLEISIQYAGEIYMRTKMFKIESSKDMFICMINLLSKHRKYEEVVKIYYDIPCERKKEFQISFYNLVIEALLELKQNPKLYSLFDWLANNPHDQNKNMAGTQLDTKPNMFSFVYLIKALIRDRKIEDAKLYFHYTKDNFKLDPFLFNAIGEAFSLCNEHQLAINTINEMTSYGLTKNTWSYNVMLSSLSEFYQGDEAIITYDQMRRENITPDVRTYSILMEMFLKQNKIEQALGMLTDIKLNKLQPDSQIYAKLIRACIRMTRITQTLELIIEASRSHITVDIYILHDAMNLFLRNYSRMKESELTKYATPFICILKEHGLNFVSGSTN